MVTGAQTPGSEGGLRSWGPEPPGLREDWGARGLGLGGRGLDLQVSMTVETPLFQGPSMVDREGLAALVLGPQNLSSATRATKDTPGLLGQDGRERDSGRGWKQAEAGCGHHRGAASRCHLAEGGRGAAGLPLCLVRPSQLCWVTLGKLLSPLSLSFIVK